MRFLSPLLAFAMLAALVFWPSCSGPSDDLAELRDEHDRLQQATDLVLRRHKIKEETALAVVARRCTLRDAVARFRQAHAGEFAADGPDPPSDDWLAWNVALWVRAILRERDGTLRDLSHLEPELRRLVEHPRLDQLSPIRLPHGAK